METILKKMIKVEAIEQEEFWGRIQFGVPIDANI